MAECFCGCGREVPFGRARVHNALGKMYDELLPVLEGALERESGPAGASELADFVDRGRRLREDVRGLVHKTKDRKDFDKDASSKWTHEAIERRKAIAEEAIEAGYTGSAWTAAKLLTAGRRAPARVVAVEDTGVTANNDPRVKIVLQVEPPGEPPFQVERKLVVSRVAIPRRGESVEVAYDPADPEKLTFTRDDLVDDPLAPLAPTPAQDPLDQLAKLGELRSAGVLTEEEFSAQKRRILGEG